MLNPSDASLWVMLHLLIDESSSEKSKLMKAQAIFKAYELDENDPTVQEVLLKHYMSSPRNYKKAFMLLVKSTHTAQEKNEVVNPVVHAFLAYLNAKALLSKQDGDL